MRKDKYGNSRSGYRAALARAEALQAQLTGDDLLACVIYEPHWNRWIVLCVDTNKWITGSFRGGYRAYCAEIWRENETGTNIRTVPAG